MDYVTKYSDFLKKQADLKRPLKIVCDGSNGATGIVLDKLGNIPNLELILINTTPNPEFPAHGPNPLGVGATDELSQKILETKADLGVVFDADGDRAFFVDNEGRLLPSFVSAAIWFSQSTPPFAVEELIYLSLTTAGIFREKDLVPTHVGAFFVKQAMQESGATLGAEFSGHFYFKDFFGTDSGLFAMIHMVNILSQQDQTLAELRAKFSRQTVTESNVVLKNATLDKVFEAINKEAVSITKATSLREGLTLTTEDGWINIRASNTEPVVRISTGTPSEEIAKRNVELISKIIREVDERER